MSQTWSFFTALTLLLQLCAGEKSCSISSTEGHVVQRGSSFEVYCTFNCQTCKGSMFSGNPLTEQRHTYLNSTTTHFKVVNITKNRTFSCRCTCRPALDPCGLDIFAGYPPDRPANISCIYKVAPNESAVFCTWNRGRDTYLWNSSELWVRTASGNSTVAYSRSSKGTRLLSASLAVSRSVQVISVWVQTQNKLSSAVSDTINYTLSDIAMPSTPDLGQPNCSSRECIIPVRQPEMTHRLEVQYSAEEQAWTYSPYPDVRLNSVQAVSVSPLEPYSLYHFRARSKFSSGLWSQWSASVSSQTQEEAPAKELDVWYAQPASDLKSLRVYWKELDIPSTRGKITEYKVRVWSKNLGWIFSANISADARNFSLPLLCVDCEVTVEACNSKGPSPPARIRMHHTEAKPLKVVHRPTCNHSVTICWTRSETAPRHTAYVVELYPEGHRLEELRWVRLGGDDNSTVLTGIKQFECYEGAVYVVYSDSSVSRTGFAGVATLETPPAAGPSVEERSEGDKVELTWSEIPSGQRGGCITNYTIYLENTSGHRKHYSMPASGRTYVIRDLSPATYSLWMTASNAKGEGRPGQKIKLFIQHETLLSPFLVCAVVSVIVLFLICLWQQSSVAKQRFLAFFYCLALDDVPDPANSKWAKECILEKGKMKLQLQSSNSSVTEDEEEPILVDVEELPKQSSDTCAPPDVSTQHYPLTTYIKSFSHDSDSSNQTQASLDTNTTVDYISSLGLGNMDEEDQEEEEEEDFVETMSFFPSLNIVMDPLEFGGKLTLDAVKINCSDLLQSNF